MMSGRFMGFDPMECRNITVNGRRTSMRLEPMLWDALSEIAEKENTTIKGICSQLDDRMKKRNEKLTGGVTPTGFTSIVRVFIADYFRKAAMAKGCFGLPQNAAGTSVSKNLSE